MKLNQTIYCVVDDKTESLAVNRNHGIYLVQAQAEQEAQHLNELLHKAKYHVAVCKIMEVKV